MSSGAKKLEHLLRTEFVGRALIYKERAASTNSDAAVGAEEGCADGTVYWAGRQSGGRGRLRRRWFSPAGMNLYFSVALRPDVPLSRASSLPLVAGVAVAAAIKQMAPDLNPLLKWPNDVLIGGRKACGILCEMQTASAGQVEHIIAGIGINVNLPRAALPSELAGIATSLKIESQRDFSRAELLALILNEFEQLYVSWKSAGFSALMDRMHAFDALKGRNVRIQRGNDLIIGRAGGFQSDGALLIETDTGVTAVYSGETKVLEW